MTISKVTFERADKVTDLLYELSKSCSDNASRVLDLMWDCLHGPEPDLELLDALREIYEEEQKRAITYKETHEMAAESMSFARFFHAIKDEG